MSLHRSLWLCALVVIGGCRDVLGISAPAPRLDADGGSTFVEATAWVYRPTTTRALTSMIEAGMPLAGSGGGPGACADAGGCNDGSLAGAGAGGLGGAGAPAVDGGRAGGGAPGEPCNEDEVDALRCDGSASPERSRCMAETMRWTSTSACQDGEACDRTDASCKPILDVCVGQAPGATVCDGRDRHTCGLDLVTSEAQSCSDSAHCQLATGTACATCIDGEHSCEGASLRVCNETHDGWTDVTTCTSSALCNAAAGQCTDAICVPDQHRCVGDQLETCNQAQTGFTQVEACDPGLCDAPGAQCDVCDTNGCENRTTRAVCSRDGQALMSQRCADAAPICVGQGSCVQCAVASDCSPAAVCTVRTCSANRCGSRNQPAGTACGMRGVCNGAGVCGVCMPDETRCSDRQPQSCSDAGAWVNVGSACSAQQLCRDAKCVGNPPYVAGYASPLSATSQLGSSVLYAQSFQVTSAARVLGIGLLVRNATSVRGIMGVYASEGGLPSSLLDSTGESTLSVGTNELGFSGAVVLPSAGTYWIVATFNGIFDTWDEVGTAVSSATSSALYAPLPAAFPSDSSFTSAVRRNFFVRLQNTQ